MRRILLFCLIIPTLVLLPGLARAEENLSYLSAWLSLGGKDGHASGSFGIRWRYIGFELGILDVDDYENDQLLDYPVPHNDYTSLGRKTFGNTGGLDLLVFINHSRRLSFYAGIGQYRQRYREVAQSNVTGWFYTQSGEDEKHTAYSGGVQFFPTEGLLLGIGYHSIRGVNGQIGYRF